jgi:hypothetical protein
LKKKIETISIEQMARQQRKELADLRAMEEEDARMTMHGSGKHFVGAGATPSMGLSQFRGGAKKGKKVMYEDEDEMEGGRFLPRITLPSFRPPSTAIVPVRPPSGAMTQYGRTNIARPSMPPSFYQNLLRPAGTASRTIGQRISGVASSVGKNITASRIAQALAMGIPLAMLGSYLSDTAGADGDAGYYDDFAGDDFGPSGPPSGGPSGGPMDGPMGGPTGTVPSDLSPEELAWYLQSGNLPERYAIRQKFGKKSRKGKGKLTITHGEEEHEGGMMNTTFGDAYGRRKEIADSPYGQSKDLRDRLPPRRLPVQPPMSMRPAVERGPRMPTVGPPKRDGRSDRAEIVRRIMQERGVKLAEASSIVKREGLY